MEVSSEQPQQITTKDKYRIRALAIKGAVDRTEQPFLNIAKGKNDKKSREYLKSYGKRLGRALKGEEPVNLIDADIETARQKIDKLKHPGTNSGAVKLINRVAILGVDQMAKKVQKAETSARQQYFTPLKINII